KSKKCSWIEKGLVDEKLRIRRRKGGDNNSEKYSGIFWITRKDWLGLSSYIGHSVHGQRKRPHAYAWGLYVSGSPDRT
ncbi:MAG: hypothetical protein PHO79_07200, partial [Desulfoplanes sp.]|nr:hypothetical protein [Desulfoplanes sp.]